MRINKSERSGKERRIRKEEVLRKNLPWFKKKFKKKYEVTDDKKGVRKREKEKKTQEKSKRINGKDKKCKLEEKTDREGRERNRLKEEGEK